MGKYDFEIAESQIAKVPAAPRDHARLLIYKPKENRVILDYFYNLAEHLPPQSFLVMNQSKVLPSRITCFKESGGKVELLLLTNEFEAGDESIKAASDRKIEVGQTLTWAKKYKFQIVKQEEQFFFLKPNFAWKHLPDLLKKFGATPIPKYIKNSPLTEKEKRKKYQSLFAKTPGSIAAPTASLHFTNRVFRNLDEKKIPQ
ncbi:MAG: S-adenosylmethionine:tRNA ribosyltransferase-isomerase, partial [Patescibacteria group bacterium]